MSKTEAAANQAAVAEQFTNLIRRSAGGDVKIFWFFAQQQVADAAANEIGLVACFVQTVEHLEGIFTDIFAGNSVLIARNNSNVRESFTLLDHDVIAVKHLAAKISDSGKNSPPRQCQS
ncbi:hypothetical protein HMPREF0201_00596 [Cedecea davisae DSM 4568]|uniref:Uncharacterized protein n=1 Tax=Cedecea davisae DSM 4568 TaxID=566551 RepID=S3J868_9ENTR|nr:hypothetical protein HMPREF0201_00596 [Cedecea davisae DSM 4568]